MHTHSGDVVIMYLFNHVTSRDIKQSVMSDVGISKRVRRKGHCLHMHLIINGNVFIRWRVQLSS